MTITILALLFLAGVLVLAAFGFKAVIKQGKAPQDLHMEKCSLCRQNYNKAVLVERQVGDYKLLYFCPACIAALHSEMVGKN